MQSVTFPQYSLVYKMKQLHGNRSNFSSSVCGKVSMKVFTMSFLGLILFVGFNLLSSNAKLSVIVDMSIKMRSNVADLWNRLSALPSAYSVNETFSLKSFPAHVNEREQKEHAVHFQFTGDKRQSFVTNYPTAALQIRDRLERDKMTEEEVISEKGNVDSDSILLDNSPEAGVGDQSAGKSDSPNKPNENQEGSNVVKGGDRDASIGRKDFINKFGNVNTTSNRRQTKCSSCFRHNFSYVIQNEKICDLYSSNQTIDLIVLIMTTHKNIRARTALRSTWLSHTKNNTANVRYAFLLGEITDIEYKEAVLQENNVFHDIIKEDFVDTYMNLTYKTIMGFKWAATKCINARFVMKTDDDMFVNIPNVLKIFKGPYSKTLHTSIIGACSTKARPIRNKKSKWFASEDSYPEKFYPGFCSGTGYVTSIHVVNEVYKISPNVPFFHLEDVYVSLCMKVLGFKLQPMPGFNAGRPKMDPCLYKGEKLITAHQLTPVMLQLVWHRKCIRKPK